MSLIKKIFFLSLFLFVFSLALWGIYNLSFKKDVPKETTAEKIPPQEITAEKKEQELSITAITDEAVISPILSENEGRIKYYSAANGKTFEINFDGQNKTALSDKELIGINDVFWSPDKTKVISRFKRPGEKIDFFLYDYEKKSGVQLKENLDTVSWQSNSAKIFYKFFDPKTKERTLNISDPDGTNWTKLTDLNYRSVRITQVPQSGLVSFWNTPDAFEETQLQTIPVIEGEKKVIFKEKFGADYLWDSSGDKFLVSHSDQKGGQQMRLGIANHNGGEYKNLNIPTFVSKCVWSKKGQTVYYALPGGIPAHSILPNDYLEGKFTTVDTFWKLDVKTGETKRLIEPEKISGKFDVSEPFLNLDESYLFFTNKIDGKLYRITL